MMRALLPFAGTFLLAALAALFGAALLRGSDQAQPMAERPDIAEIPNAGEATLALPQPRPPVYYAAITDRPLFAPGRRPGVEEAAPEPVAAPVETPMPEPDATPPDLRLLGTLDTARRQSALVALYGGEPRWVPVGDTIDGWTLSDVGADWIELSLNSRTVRLELYPQ